MAMSSFIAPSTVIPGLQTGVGVGVNVAVGSGVEVGGIGDGVNVGGTGVDVGSGVGAGAHPLIAKTVRRTNRRNIDPVDFFMTFSPFDLIAQDCAELCVYPPFGLITGYRFCIQPMLVLISAIRPRIINGN